MARIRILPPRSLYHPVLPVRSQGKLKFPLCAKCADEEYQGKCHCTEKDRCLVGCWCTPEIQKALQKGYKLRKIYEVYHWDLETQTTIYDPQTGQGGLFAPYVNMFLAIKQAASGWPADVQTAEARTQYLQDYLTHEGITLKESDIEKNPGLRSLSKLLLNSFWGKFSFSF
jgi:hypothetical protein